MPVLPIFSGKKFLKFLISIGFVELRTRGSHTRLKHSDGRVTTVPIHGNRDLPKGLIRKIIREDLEMTPEKFIELWNKH